MWGAAMVSPHNFEEPENNDNQDNGPYNPVNCRIGCAPTGSVGSSQRLDSRGDKRCYDDGSYTKHDNALNVNLPVFVKSEFMSKRILHLLLFYPRFALINKGVLKSHGPLNVAPPDDIYAQQLYNAML